MFCTLSNTCEPGPHLLGRLLRIEDEPTGALFGDNVGEDNNDDMPEWLAQAVRQIDMHAVRVAKLCPVSLLSGGLLNLLVETLGEKRGVMAALPVSSVMAIDPKACAGHAWWWLWALKRTLFSRRDSYSPRALETVYRVGGGPVRGFNWFPAGASYGLSPGVLDAYLHFGLTVTVREFAPSARYPALHAQVQLEAEVAYMALKSATIGVGPAVLAATLVFDRDDYWAANDRLLPSDAAVTSDMSVASKESQRVVALVTVTQLHTFRLQEMLHAFEGIGGDENMAHARATIQAAVVEICDKTKLLATNSILKLSMTPDTVIFCPVLEAAGDDDWDLKGFGFRARDVDVVPGKPFLWDFDPRLCKRMQEQSGYDANSAHVLMVTVLLASIRARVPGAYSVVLEAVTTPAFATAWASALENSDSFSATFTAVFQHSRVEREPLSRLMFSETLDDFTHLLRSGHGTLSSLVSEDGSRPIYQQLLMHLMGTRSYLALNPLSEEDRDFDRTTHEEYRKYMETIADARLDRLMCRVTRS